MRTFGLISVSLFLASGLSAQSGSQRVSRVPVTRNPPTGTRVTPRVANPAGGVGYPAGQGQNFGRGTAGVGSGMIIYPIYVSGYSDPSYMAAQSPAPDDQQQMQPDVNAGMQPQQQQQPTPVPVIINNYYPGATTDNPAAGQPIPQPVTVQPAADAAPASEPSEYYLIACKDHTIYAAVAYWVDGETLHYFTAGNKQNQVSLNQVDRDLTARLNRESGMEVKLTGPGK